MISAPTHDVIIIGAGPAGAAAAVTARAAGLHVALIDKARFPREKLCGGGVTGRCRGHLSDVFGSNLPDQLFTKTRRMQITAGTRVLADIDDAPPLLMTMRADLDAALLSHALAAGADDFTGQRLLGVEPDSASVTFADGHSLRGRVLIGADGVNSMTARALFGRAYDPALVGFALEVEVPGAPGADPVATLDLTAARWGYGWAFPKAHGVTFGIGGVAGQNPDLRKAFDGWLRARGLDPAAVRIKGHHLPFGDPRPDAGRQAVLLAGDAAGLVDPVTGEGIGWAVRSGQLAAQAAVSAIARGTPSQAFATYRPLLAPVLHELARARVLARIVYHPRLQQRFLNMLANSPRIQRRFLALMAGQMDYADLGLRSFARLGWHMIKARG